MAWTLRIANGKHCRMSAQSRAKNSAAVVPKVRTCCGRVPFDPGHTHADRHGLLVHIQPTHPLDLPLHGAASPGRVTDARRSLVHATLLGVLKSNDAGCRQLPRQIIHGLAVPKSVAVPGHPARGEHSRLHDAWVAP
jgi:hypothetical protein